MENLLYNRSALSVPYYRKGTAEESTVEVRNQLFVCLSLFYTSILFSTLALPGGAKQVPLSFLTGLLHFAVLAYMTRFAVSAFRLIAVMATLVVIVLETALFHQDFSPTSIIYVAAIYLPLALTLPLLDASALRTIWKHASILATTAAILGLIQLLGQLALGGFFLDPIRKLPEKILLEGYQTTYPVFYGGSLMKPNGMFLLEPSYFSQITAMGLVAEIVYFHRLWRIIILMTALTFSFSGTGFILLAPAVLFLGSPRVILGFALMAMALATVMVVLGFGDFFVKRAAETQEAGSSGNERFVAPYQEIVQQWTDSTTVCLFGKGAGWSERGATAVKIAPGAVPKVSLEYGLVGLVAFALVWASMFFGLALPRAMTVALLMLYFVANSALLQAFTIFEIWALTAGFMLRSRTNETKVRHVLPARPLSGAGRTSPSLAVPGRSR